MDFTRSISATAAELMHNHLYTHLTTHTLRDDPANQALNQDLKWLTPLKGESLELMKKVGSDGLWAHELEDFKGFITSAGLSIYSNIGDAVKANPGKYVFLIYVGLRLDPQPNAPHLEPTCFLVVGEEKKLQMAMTAMINKQILQH